ncbi:TonB-dependent receptor plug domain-containing protein [Labilibaculum antarcticum]|uniref:TonB-dependent receptor n=1 Tax=Labilibaculum antarcticum TaxID=1717717 RepID=A0A1Y1CE85_9BACT|nr:TonB-dependent receptor plug domain-containing protein [Labilibaculum antarcticum]BAX78433.1 TonB-dependent receptor [Labilibaculum antarcticum]
MKLKLAVLILSIAFAFTGVQAQTTVLKGKVTAFKYYPLNNVTVVASKSKQTVLTDSLGYFSIQVKSKKDVIKFKANGFVGQTVRYRGENDLVVNLLYLNNESAHYNAVNEKYLKEETLDYCIANQMNENNNYDRMSSIFQVIQAVNPTAQVGSVNGVESVFLNSRGANSISSGEHALILVDGVVTEQISGLSPAQVKSVKVLIGNEAAAYGSRGANGVVLISLKNN